jgi:hypothetical protein
VIVAGDFNLGHGNVPIVWHAASSSRPSPGGFESALRGKC